MPQLVKKRRSGWAVLAVGALVASLFAVGANPAAAAEIKAGDANTADPDFAATYTACLGAASTDRQFPDVTEGHAFRDAINCLAHYGITVGYEDGTFQPNVDVPRYQMVLFMERAAQLVGAKPADVIGTFATEGEREDLVRRDDMALLIANLLVASPINEPGKRVARNASGLITIGSTVSTSFDFFADARAASPRHKDEAISALYELGVVKGAAGGVTYVPEGSVNRGAMAAFITRALAHTNARPAGVTVQLDSTNAPRVSIRSDQNAPVANSRVDVFYSALDRANDVLNSDGTCTRLPGSVAGSKKCAIDTGDRRTGGDGNVLLTATSALTTAIQKGVAMWAWTGALNDTFDSDTSQFGRIDIPAKPVAIAPVSLDVATDRATGITLAPYGEEVKVTAQLKGTSNGQSVNATPAQGGTSYRLLVSNPDGTANASTLKMDAEGKAEFTFTWADPKPATAGDMGAVTYTLSPIQNARGTWAPDCDAASNHSTNCPGGNGNDDNEDPTQTGFVPTGLDPYRGAITFSDAAPVATKITVDNGAGYVSNPASGTANNSVTAKVTDQYGKGLGSQPVLLVKGDGDTRSQFESQPYTTNSAGEAAIGYGWTGGSAAVQSFTARVVKWDSSNSNWVPLDTDIMAAVSVYWVSEPALSNGVSTVTNAYPVVGGSADNNAVVVYNSGNPSIAPTILVFDTTDQYTVTISGTVSYGIESFRKALAADMDWDPMVTTNATLMWSGYNPNDPAAVTNWTITVS